MEFADITAGFPVRNNSGIVLPWEAGYARDCFLWSRVFVLRRLLREHAGPRIPVFCAVVFYTALYGSRFCRGANNADNEQNESAGGKALTYTNIPGVPDFICTEYAPRKTKYCVLIPIINEGERIHAELCAAQNAGVDKLCDIIICDGGSNDGCTENLAELGVNTLLTKLGAGKQGAQLRMGFWRAIERGYEGFITIDGNNKDSIEDVPRFVQKLDEGCDFVQGSRFVKGGRAMNTPFIRYLSVRLIHAPLISLTAGARFTDTTNAFRAYSRKYLTHPEVQPFRNVFVTYEMLAYLSVRASRLKLKTCEIPVTRFYPPKGKTPTKISFFRGNGDLLRILFNNLLGRYNP
jgi:dolichol-phosphate mannosyltransferase